MHTTHEVLEWLVSNERELQGQSAFRDGWSLAQEAVRKDFIVSDANLINAFAREIARLQEDGALRWTYSTYPNDPRPEPPQSEWFTNESLQRCRDLRLTVAGRQAVRDAATVQIRDSVIGQFAMRDINNLNLVSFFEVLEAQIESSAAPEANKAEARKLMERMKDMAGGVATGTTASLLSEALKRVLGL